MAPRSKKGVRIWSREQIRAGRRVAGVVEVARRVVGWRMMYGGESEVVVVVRGGAKDDLRCDTLLVASAKRECLAPLDATVQQTAANRSSTSTCCYFCHRLHPHN
jgi:hypothetical protein